MALVGGSKNHPYQLPRCILHMAQKDPRLAKASKLYPRPCQLGSMRPHNSWVLGSPQPLRSLLTRLDHAHIKHLIYVQNAITWGGQAALWA